MQGEDVMKLSVSCESILGALAGKITDAVSQDQLSREACDVFSLAVDHGVCVYFSARMDAPDGRARRSKTLQEEKEAFLKIMETVPTLILRPMYPAIMSQVRPPSVQAALNVQFSKIANNRFLLPFHDLKSSVKDGPFVVRTAESFARVWPLLREKWGGDVDLVAAVPWLIMNRLSNGGTAFSDADVLRSHSLAIMMLEARALAFYERHYSPLSANRKKNPTDKTVRGMFWHASYFYSSIDVAWEKPGRLEDLSWLGSARYNDVLGDFVRGEYVGYVSETREIHRRKDDMVVRLISSRAAHPGPCEMGVINSCLHQLNAVDLNGVPLTLDQISEFEAVMFHVEFSLGLCDLAGFDGLPVVDNPPQVEQPGNEARAASSIFQQIDLDLGIVVNARQQVARDMFSDPVVREGGVLLQGLNDDGSTSFVPDQKSGGEREHIKAVAFAKELVGEWVNAALEEAERREKARIEEELAAEEAARREQVGWFICFGIVASEGVRPQERLHEAFREKELVLAREGMIPAQAARDMAVALAPAIEFTLQPAVDCFMCLQTLDFRSFDGIRYLVCCEGGSFACAQCVSVHGNIHPVQGELHIVRMTAALRRRFKVGEFEA